MTELNIEGEIDEILGTLSDFYFHPTSDPTMAQVHGRAKQALIELVAKQPQITDEKCYNCGELTFWYDEEYRCIYCGARHAKALSSNKQGGKE